MYKQLAYCDDPSHFCLRDGSFEFVEVLEKEQKFFLRRKGKLGCFETRNISEKEKNRIIEGLKNG